MIKITIYKDKITATKRNEDNTLSEHDISKLDGTILKYLNRVVEVKPDVTIEDFMKHLERYEMAIDYCFSDYLKGHPFRLFLDDMNLRESETDLEEIELCWEGEIINEDFIMIGYLRGWISDEKIKELGPEYEFPQEVNFIPIHVWKNCLFRLNDNIIINHLGDEETLEKEVVFAGIYSWTLYEVISKFLEELSLNGSPNERDELLVLMENKKYDVKEIAKNAEQTEFWLAFLKDELKDLRTLMENSNEVEDYEQSNILKKEIEASEKELFNLIEEVKKYNGDV
jgi:hypothetical protein